MARSWLYPALNVHRSALPLTSTSSAAVAVKVLLFRLAASMICQDAPSLLLSVYCCVLTSVPQNVGEALDGRSHATSRAGENGADAPAPMVICPPPAGLFVFQTSWTVYCVLAAKWYTVCTKAAFGEKVPAY